MMIDVTLQEADSAIDKLTCEMTETFDENVATLLRKLIPISTEGQSRDVPKVVYCPECEYFYYSSHSFGTECPSCGWDPSAAINIEDRVILPEPNYVQGHEWSEGDIAVVEGVEDIDGEQNLIVRTNDGRSWCIPGEECEKVE